MLFSPRARRCGTMQTLSPGDGLVRKPTSDYVVCIVTVMCKECLGSSSCIGVLWQDGRRGKRWASHIK
jgi:hypothetical protein